MFNVFKDFFRNIDESLDGFLAGTVSDLVTFLTPIVTSLLIICIAIWGIGLIRGLIQEPLQEGLARIIKIVFIVSIALNLGIYNGVVVDFFYSGPDQLASVISGVSPSSALIDNLAEKGIIAGFRAWNEGGFIDGDFGMYLFAFAIWISTAIVVGYTGFLLVLSKLALSALLALGPIFIILILFKSTQRFFELWLGQVVNYGILVVISVTLIQLLIGIFIRFMDSLNATPDPKIKGMISVMILSIVTFLILLQVPSIAMSLGGGVALSSLNAVGAALRKMPMTSWLMATRPSRIASGARGAYQGLKADTQTLTAPGRSLGNLARRRFGGNSITGK